jgi:tetratricopeptide (TPR) repeat protein
LVGGIAVALSGWVSLAAQAKPSEPSLSDLETRARQDSNDAGALYELGLRYWLVDRLADAEREFHQATTVDPHFAPAVFALGTLPYAQHPKLWSQQRKGKVPHDLQSVADQAVRLQYRAFILDPFVDFRVYGAKPPDEGLFVIPDYGKSTTDFLAWLGVEAFDYERYELSRSALEHFVERAYPGKPIDSLPSNVLFYRGLASAHLGLWPQAITDFQNLLARSQKEEQKDSLILFPLNTNDYRYTLAVLEVRAGHPADAMNLLKETLATDLGLFMAHVRLADLYEQYQMWNDAVTERRRAVEANPDDAALVRDLGATLVHAGRAADAETVLHQAMDANPRDPGAPYVLGIAEQALNKAADARAALTRYLALAPSSDTQRIADAKGRLAKLP